jgi:hypothetical protein
MQLLGDNYNSSLRDKANTTETGLLQLTVSLVPRLIARSPGVFRVNPTTDAVPRLNVSDE